MSQGSRKRKSAQDVEELPKKAKKNHSNPVALKKAKKGSSVFEKNRSNASSGTQNVKKPTKKAEKIQSNKVAVRKPKKGSSGFEKNIKNTSSGKPDWADFKKKKKQLKITRKEHKSSSVFVLSQKTKKLWEAVRRSDCPSAQRENLTADMHNLLKNNLQKVVHSHDLSRVVQWILKIGTPSVREAVIQELAPCVPAMLMSTYACFCVKMMLKYGSHSSRKAIVRSLHGNVVKLASHSIAAPVLEHIYSTWTSSVEKSQLRQEFYGDLYKHEKEMNIHGLEDIFRMTPKMKPAVLSTVKGNISRMLDKKLANSSLLHTVVLDFLKHCSKPDQEEILQQVQDCILDFKNSKDGAHVAVMCVGHASNKVKKQCMKSLKSNMKEVATSEHGYLILLALFDTVDDTVMMKKMLMPELLGDLLNIASNEYGRKVILYLVAHRDSAYFHPTEVEILKNAAALGSSKKDGAVRLSELLDAVSDPLLETISADVSSWMKNNSIGMVTLAILKSGKGPELVKCYKAIVDYITDDANMISEGGKEYVPVEHPGIHFLLKKLIHHDRERDGHEETFSFFLASQLTDHILKSWTSHNRGCFLLVALVESQVEPAVDKITMKSNLLKMYLKKKDFVGAQILGKAITKL